MPWWQALVLGVVQGLTEFLPISSSGHLVLFQRWFGLGEVALSFDIFLHLATLVAIIGFFGRSLFKVSLKEWILVAVATVPAVVVGLLWKDQIEQLFVHDAWLGWELMVTGLINFYIEWQITRPASLPTVAQTEKNISPFKAFLIGIAQAIAIIPAISRSGSTVAGAVAMGMSREKAFRFSFLLAIPALAGAGVLQLKDVAETGWGQLDPVAVGIGSVAALVTGWLSLYIFKYVMEKAKLQWFGWYCVVLGAAVIFWRF